MINERININLMPLQPSKHQRVNNVLAHTFLFSFIKPSDKLVFAVLMLTYTNHLLTVTSF